MPSRPSTVCLLPLIYIAYLSDARAGNENPDPLDTDRVDYITALGLEAGRYFASTRLGFPRETTEDVTIDGVLIPAGTIVAHNTYSVNRDPARYDYVDEFIPERWLDGHYGRVSEKGARVGLPHLTNGAGRRYCLGVPCKLPLQPLCYLR